MGYAHVLFGARVFPRMVHGLPISDLLRLVSERETFWCEDREIARPKCEMAKAIEEYVDNEYRISGHYVLLRIFHSAAIRHIHALGDHHPDSVLNGPHL